MLFILSPFVCLAGTDLWIYIDDWYSLSTRQCNSWKSYPCLKLWFALSDFIRFMYMVWWEGSYMVCFCILLFGLFLHMGKQALMRYEAKILLCHSVFPFGYRLSCFFFLCSLLWCCASFFLYRFLEGFISVQFVSMLLLLPAGCCYVAVPDLYRTET